MTEARRIKRQILQHVFARRRAFVLLRPARSTAWLYVINAPGTEVKLPLRPGTMESLIDGDRRLTLSASMTDVAETQMRSVVDPVNYARTSFSQHTDDARSTLGKHSGRLTTFANVTSTPTRSAGNFREVSVGPLKIVHLGA